MEFIVTDRKTIEAGLLVRSSYIVISIRDPETNKARIPKQSSLRDVLYLAFHDAEPAVSMTMPEDITLMKPEQAEQVREFFRKHEGQVGTIVIHCEQGMSRSPAVAAALCKVMGGDDTRFWQDFQPNRHVYRLVLDALAITLSKAG